jgi:EAL domain-containing protein (putative c-di-GMP-specific phosphodiesterase class I)
MPHVHLCPRNRRLLLLGLAAAAAVAILQVQPSGLQLLALGSDGLAGQIVAVVAGIARQMNLELVAEGVENAEVLAALQAHGIGLFQGYHFHRPQPAEALIAAGAPA